MSSVVERLWGPIDSYVAAEGIELDDVEVLGGGQIVRVTVDAADPIGVDVIADLSRGISRIIDDEDPISGSYTLEVSSPGLERKLSRPAHYRKSIGRTLKVKTHAPIDGDKTHTGTLAASSDSSFRLDINGVERTIAYPDVASARTVFAWEKSSRPGTDS